MTRFRISIDRTSEPDCKKPTQHIKLARLELLPFPLVRGLVPLSRRHLHLLGRQHSFSNMAVDSSALTEALYELSAKKPKLVKSSNYEAPADNTIKVTSWKMNEFKYYDVPSPFPTLARGLFTTENADEEGGTNVKYRIVVRGYDKFFNIGEVPWTNVGASLFPSLPPLPSFTETCSK